jgi:hypothetical protein
MDDEVMPVVFVMIFLQMVAMWNNNQRIDHLETVIALEVTQQAHDASMLEEYEKSVLKSLSAQVDRSLAAKIERADQYEQLIRHLDQRSTDRITRTEVETWRQALMQMFPWLPEIPRINSPATTNVPMLPSH